MTALRSKVARFNCFSPQCLATQLMRKSCFVMVSKGKGDLDLDLDIFYSLCFFFKRCTNFLYKQEAGPTMKSFGGSAGKQS